MKKSRNGKPGTLGNNDYFEKLEPLQLELNDLARWLVHTGRRLMVVIEGRDMAGQSLPEAGACV
jgi:polyphosphate kinase 2 (PPK2 family)